jgi:uncharacterized protein with FMN-binding domain
MKKRWLPALALMGALALMYGCAAAPLADDSKTAAAPQAAVGGTYADGAYVGVARGYKRGLHVEVTVKDGKIADIRIGDNNEDEPYLTDSLVIIPKMIETQSTDVDAVASATKTCDGIEKAVRDALSQAAQS